MTPAVSAAAPVFALYRAILRLHAAKLPPPMRVVGDRVAREEFRSHLQNARTTHEQWKTFMNEWRKYLDMLSGTADLASPISTSRDGMASVFETDAPVASLDRLVTGVDRAGDLSDDVLQQLTPDQRTRLLQLRREALKFGESMHDDDEKNAKPGTL
jgi:hypothetical protein